MKLLSEETGADSSEVVWMFFRVLMRVLLDFDLRLESVEVDSRRGFPSLALSMPAKSEGEY